MDSPWMDVRASHVVYEQFWKKFKVNPSLTYVRPILAPLMWALGNALLGQTACQYRALHIRLGHFEG